MERNAEYIALKEELTYTPDDLECTLTRAQVRRRQSKRRRMFSIPVQAVLALVAVFTLLVNTSWGFALALSRMPVLSDLAAAVAFSPSLKMAVENGYVQLIDQEQTKNGITLSMKYMLVDETQINIFYTVQGEPGKNYSVWPDTIRFKDGKDIQLFGMGGDGFDHELRKLTIDFGASETPNGVSADFHVNNFVPGEGFSETLAVAEFTFSFRFDSGLMQKVKTYTIGQSFTLDGQAFTVKTVEVYPMTIRIDLEADAGNTKWIKALRCYIEDENGNRYEPAKDGISAADRDETTPMHNGFRLESSYFGGGNDLTLYITGAVWLDKDAPRAKVDLNAGTAKNLPRGVTLDRIVQENGEYELHFLVPGAMKHGYRDQYGQATAFEHYYCMEDSDSAEKEQNMGFAPSAEQTGREYYTLNKNETSFVIYLTPQYTGDFNAEEPVIMKIK